MTAWGRRAIAVLALGLALGGLATAEAEPGRTRSGICPAPFAPIDYRDTYESPDPVPEVPGTDVATVPASTQPSPAPTATFARSGAAVTLAGGVGDLDGDGADEYLVLVSDPTTHRRLETWLISGALGPGTYDPADVGVHVATGVGLPLADRTDDGTGEVVVTDLSTAEVAVGDPATGEGNTVVYDGAALGDLLPAAPTDGRTTGLLAQAPGLLVALAPLRPGPPALVVVQRVFVAAPPPAAPTDQFLDEIRITLLDGREVLIFTTKPHPAVLEYAGLDRPQVLVGDDAAYLVLNPADRSGAAWYLWRIDDPCGPGPTTTTTTTTAAPAAQEPAAATPVSGTSTYTG